MKITRVIKKLFPKVSDAATAPIYPFFGALVVVGFLALSWVAIWFELTLGRYPRLTCFVVGLFMLYAGAWLFRCRRSAMRITDDFRVHIMNGSNPDRQALRQGIESLLAFNILLSIACFYLGGLQ